MVTICHNVIWPINEGSSINAKLIQQGYENEYLYNLLKKNCWNKIAKVYVKLSIGPQGNKILTICVFFVKYLKKNQHT